MARAPVSAGATPAGAVRTIVAMGLCVTILEGYDIQAMGVAAPIMPLMRSLTPEQKGWVFAASMVGLVLGALLGGWLADRIGRKPVLLGSVVAFGLFSIATIPAPSWPPLVAARIATGLGLGGALPTLIAVAAETARRERRTITTTLMFSGMPIGGALAALVVQYGVPLADWRLIFLIGGILPLAVVPAIWRLLPATGPRGSGHARPRPGLSAVLIGLFGRGRLVPTLLLWLAFVLTLIVLYILLNWLPLLAEAKGMARRDAGLTALAYNLGSVPGALLLGGAVDRWGLRRVMVASFGMATLTMLAFALAEGAVAMLALSALAGWCVIGSLYVLYAVTPIYYPPAVRGTGAGAAVGVGRLGSIAGPMVAGLLLGTGFSASQVMLLLAPAMLVGGTAVLLLTVLGRPFQDCGRATSDGVQAKHGP